MDTEFRQRKGYRQWVQSGILSDPRVVVPDPRVVVPDPRASFGSVE